MQRRTTSALVSVSATLAATVLAFTPAGPANAADPRGVNPNTDGATSASIDTGSALVQLSLDPLTTSPKTRPAKGKKVDFNNTTVKSERARLAAQRNDFKQWLQANAPKAKVTGEYDISLNAVAIRLNGTSLATLRSAPNVTAVEYEGRYRPTADPDLSLISAEAAWSAGGSGGAANAGRGVKVAIIDTGIDISNPCFSDTGYPNQAKQGPSALTNNKVIVAKVFNNNAKVAGYTPEALQEHGTHVAGTVACNYHTPASVDGATTYAMSGVAPAALLGNYNIFPAEVKDARSEDILNALDAAYADSMDVANMSLGGGSHGVQDLVTHAVDNLDRGNMVVAIAAGNSGPGHYTVESPGMAARALTAGAASVGHFVGTPVSAGSGSWGAAVGDFNTVTASLTAPLAVTSGDGVSGLNKACTAFGAASLSGKIALVQRGDCSFSTKIRNAQNAGALAALVVNNVGGDPTAMGQDGTDNQPSIPAYSMGKASGEALQALGNGVSTTIGTSKSYFVTGNDDIMAGFSSQGPTDVDFRVKPDVVAPGVNVLSSVPHQFCDVPPCFAFFQGTSMATPHLAGSAAVVIGQHRDWSAAQVRSAIVNTADQGVLKKSNGTATASDPNLIGAGRENLLSAVRASTAIEPVSVSFGAFPVGSGQTRTATVTVSDLDGVGGATTISVASSAPGVVFSAPGSVTIPAGGSATFTVTMTSVKGAAPGDYSTTLTVGGSHMVLYAFGK